MLNRKGNFASFAPHKDRRILNDDQKDLAKNTVQSARHCCLGTAIPLDFKSSLLDSMEWSMVTIHLLDVLHRQHSNQAFLVTKFEFVWVLTFRERTA